MGFVEKYAVRRWAWEGFLLLMVGWMISYTWMYGAISVPNERSRVYLAVAMWDDHTVQIDAPLERWGKIYDLAERDGHYYSDKAPGSSILGAVVYGVARLFTQPNEWTIQELINLMRTWLMLPVTLIGFLLLRRIMEYLGLDPPAIDIASLAWVLGSAAFHYGAAFFGHQIVAVALLASLYCILRAETAGANGRDPLRWAVAAGACAGIAGLTEYQAAIPCILLTFFVASGDYYDRPRTFVAWALGAAPFALILFAYNDAAFGGPLQLSYDHLSSAGLQEIHGEGVGGVTTPTWEYFKGSMFSLHRGLFATSPLFLLAIPGIFYLWKRSSVRVALLVGGTLLFYVLFISSSNMWFAGWGFGPRLLVPGMGLWSIAVAFTVQEALQYPATEGIPKGLAAAQILYHQIVVAFFPEPPDSSETPFTDYVGFMWDNELTSANLGRKYLGLNATESIQLIFAFAVVAVLIVTFRGWKRWPKRTSKGIIAIGFVITFSSCIGYFMSSGPTWKDSNRTKWEKLVKGWEARERFPPPDR